MNELKRTRLARGISQTQASEILCVSLRTYQRYERDDYYSKKIPLFCDALNSKYLIDEEHGLLTIDSIKNLIKPFLQKFNISICYLFGSYAKGKAKPTSDVDLLVDCNFKGIEFFGAVEELRNLLNKKVDLITVDQLVTSKDLLIEILKGGIRIND